MKKMLTMLLLTITLLTSIAHADTYAMTTVVVDIDYTNDIVTVVDFNDNLWAFDGCEDWTMYDICSLTMDTNDTDIIYDDIIVNAKYDGWLSGWLERLGL